MIVDPPTATALNQVAIRLYFSAWESLLGLKMDFDSYWEAAADDWYRKTDEWKEEWPQYLTACRPELETICAIIQQSNELALKARICEVSPYLLLLKSDLRFKNEGAELKFSDLRTLDAVDLPGAVNTICETKLTSSFVQSYNELRALRNKYTHIGETGRELSIEWLAQKLLQQYQSLWPNREWLVDRLRSASTTRNSYFHDYSYSSPYSDVLYEWPYILKFVGKGDFKRLFGFPKSARRYLCHSCFDSATTKTGSPSVGACETAYLLPGREKLKCLLCGETTDVTEHVCETDGCNGDILAADGQYFGCCHSCGEIVVEA